MIFSSKIIGKSISVFSVFTSDGDSVTSGNVSVFSVVVGKVVFSEVDNFDWFSVLIGDGDFVISGNVSVFSVVVGKVVFSEVGNFDAFTDSVGVF
ncbi:MAG: hypothetical protein KME54_26620 [Tolypothrix brevis GSE-NOS-MK-07-07A]|nr:hypothetical protein [Tolypothrix brevis GSE-NOS-MK-07-07A]